MLKKQSSIGYVLVLLAVLFVNVRSDDIENEIIELDRNRLKLNTLIYTLKQTDTFQPPFYLIPIQPAQATSEFNINLSNGEIYLSKIPSMSNEQYKFSVLSIMYGTAKMLIINIINDAELTSATITNITPITTTAKDIDVKTTSTSFTTTNMARTLNEISSNTNDKEVHYYLLPPNSQSNYSFGQLDILISSQVEYEYKSLIYIDTSTGQLYSKMSLPNGSFLIRVSIKATNKVVYLYLKFFDSNIIDEEILLNLYVNRVQIGTLIDYLSGFGYNTNSKYFLIHSNGLNKSDVQNQFEINTQTGDIKILRLMNVDQVYTLDLVIFEPNGNHVNTHLKRIIFSTIQNEKSDFDYLISGLNMNVTKVNRQTDLVLNLNSYLNQFSIKYTNLTHSIDDGFYYDQENFNLYRLRFDNSRTKWPLLSLNLSLFNQTFNNLNDLSKKIVYLNSDFSFNVKSWFDDKRVKFVKNYYEFQIHKTTPLHTVVFSFLPEIQFFHENLYNFNFQIFPFDLNYFEMNELNGDLIVNNLNFDSFVYFYVYFNYYVDDQLQTERTLLRVDLVKVNRFKPEFQTDSVINAEVYTINEPQLITQIFAEDIDSGVLNFTIKQKNEEFTSFFNFNTKNGQIWLKPQKELNKNQLYKFDFSVTVYDSGLPCLYTTKAFKLNLIHKETIKKIGIEPNEWLFKQKYFNSSIYENKPLNTKLNIANSMGSRLNSLLSTATQMNNSKFNLIDPTNTFKIENQMFIVTNSSIDRETVGNYTLYLYLTDNTNTIIYDTCVVFVRILDLNDNPPVFYYNQTNRVYISIYEDKSLNYTFPFVCVDNDIDENARLSYYLGTYDEHDKFEVNQKTGLFKIKKQLKSNKYTLTVFVADNGVEPQKTAIQVEINVRQSMNSIETEEKSVDLTINDGMDLSQEMLLTNLNGNYSLDVHESSIIDNQIYKIYLLYRIETLTGELYCKLWYIFDKNYENFYLNFNKTLQITLKNIQRDSASTLSLRLNLNLNRNFQIIASNNRPFVYQTQYAVCIDEGLPVNSFVLNLTVYNTQDWVIWFNILNGNDDSSFKIDYNSKNLMLNANLLTNQILDSEIRNGYKIKIGVFMKANEILFIDYIYIDVYVNDRNDNTPNFGLETNVKEMYLNETTPIGSAITKINSYDMDKFDVIEYSIDDTSCRYFFIDKFTGVLLLVKSLDYETVTVHNVSVKISDGSFTSTLKLIIRLIDENDNLVLVGQNGFEAYFYYLNMTSINLNVNFIDYDATTLNSNVNCIDLQSNSRIDNNKNVVIKNNLDFKNFTVLIFESKNLVDYVDKLQSYKTYTVVYVINNYINTKSEFRTNIYEFYVNETAQIGSVIGHIDVKYQNTDLFYIDSEFNQTFKLSKDKDDCRLILIDGLILSTYEFELRIQPASSQDAEIVASVKVNVLKLNENVNKTIGLDFDHQAIHIMNNQSVEIYLHQKNTSIFEIKTKSLYLNRDKVVQHINADPNVDILNEILILQFNQNVFKTINFTIKIDGLLANLNFISNYKLELSENSIQNLLSLNILPKHLLRLYDVKYEIVEDTYKHMYDLSQGGVLSNKIVFDYESLNEYELNLNDTQDVLNTRKHTFTVKVSIKNSTFTKTALIQIECKITDVDEYKPQFLLVNENLKFYSNLTVNSMIYQLNSVDYDGGVYGRVYCHLTDPNLAQYFYLNQLNGQLKLQKSFNTNDTHLKNFKILTYDSEAVQIPIEIECDTSINGSLSNKKILNINVNFNCSNCIYPNELAISGSGGLANLKNFNLIILIIVIILIILLLMILIILVKLKIDKKTQKTHEQQATTSQSSLFFNSTTSNTSTCSNHSTNKFNNATLTSRSTAITHAGSSTHTDTYKILRLDSSLSDNNVLNEYLSRLGIDLSQPLQQSQQHDMQQHFYHDFLLNNSESNGTTDNNSNRQIDGILFDLKRLIGENNFQNIDLDLIKNFVQVNLNSNSGNLATTASGLNSLIESNHILNDELSFIKWNNLLDWTPQYSTYSDLFDDLTRLSTVNDELSVRHDDNPLLIQQNHKYFSNV